MNNTWLDINILEAYLNGTLDPKTMHRVEKEALDDPFIADALEGLSQSPAYSSQSLSLLQKQLQERVVQQKATRKASVITWQRLSIAAAAAVIFISAGIIFMMRQPAGLNQNAKNKEVEVSLSPLPKDSLSDMAATVKSTRPEIKPSAGSRSTAPARPVSSTPAAEPVKEKTTESEMEQAIANVKTDALAQNKVRSDKLEEVVIQGYAAQQKKATLTGAVPVNVLSSRIAGVVDTPTVTGRVFSAADSTQSKAQPAPSISNADYTGYLKSNNKFYTGGSPDKYVELSFRVTKDGTPIRIKITKGLEQKYNDEAIRLLTDGPKWKVPEKGSNKATLKIYF